MNINTKLKKLLDTQSKGEANNLINDIAVNLLTDTKLDEVKTLELITKLLHIKQIYGLIPDKYSLDDIRNIINTTLLINKSNNIHVNKIYMGFNRLNEFNFLIKDNSGQVVTLFENKKITSDESIVETMDLEKCFLSSKLSMYFIPFKYIINTELISKEDLLSIETKIKLFLEENPLFIKEAIDNNKTIELLCLKL